MRWQYLMGSDCINKRVEYAERDIERNEAQHRFL